MKRNNVTRIDENFAFNPKYYSVRPSVRSVGLRESLLEEANLLIDIGDERGHSLRAIAVALSESSIERIRGSI